MSMIVLLDAGTLGKLTSPKSSLDNEACKNWLASLAYQGVEVVIPEITDYEVRRELLRAAKDRGLGRLDALKGMLEYAPITTAAMLMAAEFWATARKMGRQAAEDASLDADMILAAQGFWFVTAMKRSSRLRMSVTWRCLPPLGSGGRLVRVWPQAVSGNSK